MGNHITINNMKKTCTSLLLLFLFSCSQPVVLNDELYIKIAGEAVCSDAVDDTPIYQKYGVTTEQMNAYKQIFSQNEQKRQDIATKILQAAAECISK